MNKRNRFKACFGLALILSFAGFVCSGNPSALPAPNMTFLDNGEVRIGMDLALGGAVNWL